MAMFIPEWGSVSGRHMLIKRVLNSLDDKHVIRRALRKDDSSVDFFIQHQALGWLAIVAEDIGFAEVDPVHLFVSQRRLQFKKRLEALVQLANRTFPTPTRRLGVCVVMWMCTTAETHMLSKIYDQQYQIELLSREEFEDLTPELLSAKLKWITVEAGQGLLRAYFPEAEIPTMSTARGYLKKDNKSKLGRIFLDFEQEWASKLDLDIPEASRSDVKDHSIRLINGVAGSGKTLIAVHRALLLAESYPLENFLILIYNTPVVADIKEKLHRTRDSIPANLTINTFYEWARKQWLDMFDVAPQVDNKSDVTTDLIHLHRKKWPELKCFDDQLLSELDFINDSLIVSEVEYLQAPRQGRKFSLKPKERIQVWALHEIVTKSLRERGLMTWSSWIKDICMAKDQHIHLQKYQQILVDEAQFFAPSWFELVKLSVKREGQLFLCADPNQGFMKNRLSWKSVGLEVVGRTKRLQKSYRTTRQILTAAYSMIDTLEHADREDYLEPNFFGMPEGPDPILIYTHAAQDMVDRLTNEIEKTYRVDGVPLATLLVVMGETIDRQFLYSQFCQRFSRQAVWWFNKEDQKKAPADGYGREHLRMASVASATGLEGGVVFLVGVDELFMDGKLLNLREDQRQERHEKQRRMLFMAMTRAGHQLVLIASQRLPIDMEKQFKIVA